MLTHARGPRKRARGINSRLCTSFVVVLKKLIGRLNAITLTTFVGGNYASGKDSHNKLHITASRLFNCECVSFRLGSDNALSDLCLVSQTRGR